MIYFIILFSFHYIRKIEGMLISKILHFNDSLTFNFLMFSGEFLGGLSVILYHKIYFLHQINIRQKLGVKIGARMRPSDNWIKIIILIFFAAFFDFNEYTISCKIPELAIISATSESRLCIIITIISSLLCTYALRIKTGKHHTFSLIGMSICSVIILILELIYKSKGNDFGKLILSYALVFCRHGFISLIDVTEKYLVEYNFINKYKILSTEGFFGILLCITFSVISKKNPLTTINKVYKELDVGESILLIFFFVLYFFLSAGVNIYKIICNVVYTPMAKSLPAYFLNPLFIIYYFIWENDFTSGGEQNYFYFIMNVILSIIIDIFALIYNEFFIINCFGLEKQTHYEISQRSLKYSANQMVELQEEFGRNFIDDDYYIYN